MSRVSKILVPPVSIGDHIYTKGHGNRKTPDKWDVVFLGYNGEKWFINIVLYHGKEFIKSAQIEGDWLNKTVDGYYFTDESYIH